jgi:AraC family transcriptional regulator of adaptative response / DNA-3-methyladenine glycosylase II
MGHDVRMKLSHDECYKALSARDARYDGRFFICVNTTGIFCRPICPARPPKPQNCFFVETAEAALALGFRACKRCRPEVRQDSAAWVQTQSSIKRAMRLIAGGALDDTPIEDFAARLGIGGRHLRRLIKSELGVAPKTLALARRASFARDLIENSQLPMTAIAAASGFASLRRFNEVVRTAYGGAPTHLRRERTGRTGDDASLSLSIRIAGPFDWNEHFSFFKERAIAGVENAEAGVYRRILTIGDSRVALKIKAQPDVGVNVELRGAKIDDLYAITKRVRRALDLDTDIAAIGKTLGADPFMRALIRKRPCLRLPGAWGEFELAVRALLGQQISVKAARTIAGRLSERFGQNAPANMSDWNLRWAFPMPEAIADATESKLTGIGLTGRRAAALRSLGRAAASDPDLFAPAASLEQLIERLQALDGFGPWTAHYVALRAFHEPDAFPASDLGLRKALANADGGLPSEREVLARAEAWRPWRGYAAQHLWASLGADEKKESDRDMAA